MLVLAVAVLSAGTLLLLDAVDLLPFSATVLAWACAATVCALGVIGYSLAGKRSGVLGFFAFLAVVATAILAVAPKTGAWVIASNRDWIVSSHQQVDAGYSLTAANGTLRLNDLNLDAESTMPLTLNAARAELIIPDDQPVRIQNSCWIAKIDGPGNTERSTAPAELWLNQKAENPVLTIDLRGSICSLNLVV